MDKIERLKPAAAAKYLGVSVKTLQRWDRQGILVAGRLTSNRRVYTRAQLDAMLKERS